MVLYPQGVVWPDGVGNYQYRNGTSAGMAESDPPGTPLARIMRDRGLTQVKLAEMVRAKQPEIQRLFSGERPVNARWAKRLAPALECHWLDVVDQRWLAQNHLLTREETGLVELYRGLAEDDRKAVYRHADALKEQKALTAKTPPDSKER